MSITFACKCGRRLKVSDAMAGRMGKCPFCGASLVVPDSSDAYDAARFETESAHPCPACKEPMSPGAVICTNCGYHRIAGTRLKTLEEEQRQEKSPRLRIMGVGVSPWLVLAAALVIVGLGVWYWRGPARPLRIDARQYVHVTEVITGGQTQPDSSLTIGGNDALLVTAPDPAGPYLLLRVGLKSSVIRDRQQTAGYESLFKDGQFALQPADGSPPIPARMLAVAYPQQVHIDLAAGGTSNYRKLLPPVEPSSLDVSQTHGFVQGEASWIVPRVMGQVRFAAVSGVGGAANTGGASATGSIQIADPRGNVIDMQYTGQALSVHWPQACTGWWARPRWTRPTHTEPWRRHRFALLIERPAAGGRHTLLYMDRPIATVTTATPPAPRPPAASPLKGASPSSRQAQQAPPTNNPLNYFSGLAKAKQRGEGLVAASNIRQFAIAIQMYQDQHRRYPQSFEELIEFDPALRNLLVNPRTGDVPGYIYEPPPPGADPRATPILWESLNARKDPDGAILYADGHIE